MTRRKATTDHHRHSDSSESGVCWERILQLPLADIPTTRLYDEAGRIVRSYRTATDDAEIDWLERQTGEAHDFVADRIATEPDEHWERIMVSLEGALDAMHEAGGDARHHNGTSLAVRL